MPYLAKDFVEDIKSPYAWPGSYPKYFIMHDGDPVSFKWALEHKQEIIEALADNQLDIAFDPDHVLIGCDVNWENHDLYCCFTNEKIESAY